LPKRLSGSSYRTATLLLLSCIFSFLLLESALRFFVAPSPLSSGRLFGRELPPLRIVPESKEPQETDFSQPFDDLVVDGQRITLGDLYGFREEDPVLGYTNAKNAVSANRWWQSNNLGARSRSDVTRRVPAGRIRLLVFGESFAQGSRVPQEDVWSEILARRRPDLEVMNFGVEGYSMGQALLRYERVRKQLDYNLMLVPDADLWRDINTSRDLVNDWGLPYIMPRFVVTSEGLQLAASPYASRADFLQRNVPQIEPRLREHLRKYDRFYVPCMYEESGFLGRSILYRLGCRAYYSWFVLQRLRSGLMDPAGEAVRVTRAIVRKMRNEVEQQGGSFALVLLPDDVGFLRENRQLLSKWRGVAASVCGPDVACINLLEDMKLAPKAKLDKGYDGTHYGPAANRLIAELVERRMEHANVPPF